MALEQSDFDAIGTACINAVKHVILNDDAARLQLRALPWQYPGGGTDLPTGTSILNYFGNMYRRVDAIGTQLGGVAAGVSAENAEQVPSAEQVADAVFARLGGQATAAEKADLLRAALGDDAAEVGRLLAGQG